MSIQKFQASMVSGTQETNFSLGNLNLGFSLLKIEVPAEFKPLGNELSSKRKQAAEEGSQHITARKLAVLFQTWLPKTTHLISAYGMRVSEIAGRRDVNPKATPAHGIFADHVGIDCTTIWAAATSGAGAIAAHLLACMLARVWSRSEATAIWVELLAERQRELEEVDETDPLYEPSRDLARISITREQLREWDAGARAWLLAADEAMRVKQTQLMLIANNVGLPVDSGPGLFRNVMRAWRTALVTIDNLIRGVPQSVETGSVLLALASWHIYPDMLVLQDSPVPVEQHDPLVKSGGIVTIGLSIESQEHDSVYWSLPLGHLRYYGEPVKSEKSLGTRTNRVTMLNLFQVAVGCLIRNWAMDKMKLARFLSRIWQHIAPIAGTYTDGTQHWLYHLVEALEPLMSKENSLNKTQCLQMIRMGERRCLQSFVCTDLDWPSVFGLGKISTLLSLLEPSDTAISHLRSHVSGLKGLSHWAVIARYSVGKGLPFVYATVLPLVDPNASDLEKKKRHFTWMAGMKLPSNTNKGEAFLVSMDIENLETPAGGRRSAAHIRWNNPPPALHPFALRDVYGTDSVNYVDFDYVAGNTGELALYISKRPLGGVSTSVPRWRSGGVDAILQAIDDGDISPERLLAYLSKFLMKPERWNTLTSLRVLATAKSIYSMLPGATVALEVTTQVLHEMPWIPARGTQTASAFHCFSLLPLTRQQAFSYVILFETGTIVTPPGNLGRVLAVATGDSIYISAPLLCDPAESPAEHEIRRIRGNIGRPGIAVLIPPETTPRMRRVDSSSWQVVSHATFDGRTEDAFASSTLHLSFTDYVLPIDVGVHGFRDFEIYFLESVVSVHDRGQWVADLDILGQLDSSRLCRVDEPCPHGDEAHGGVAGNPKMTSVDHWEEILDGPDGVGVVRSANNWTARLAATALCLQMGHDTMILPSSFCWKCVVSTWDGSGWKGSVPARPPARDRPAARARAPSPPAPAPKRSLLEEWSGLFRKAKPAPPRDDEGVYFYDSDPSHCSSDGSEGASDSEAGAGSEELQADVERTLGRMTGLMLVC